MRKCSNVRNENFLTNTSNWELFSFSVMNAIILLYVALVIISSKHSLISLYVFFAISYSMLNILQ